MLNYLLSVPVSNHGFTYIYLILKDADKTFSILRPGLELYGSFYDSFWMFICNGHNDIMVMTSLESVTHPEIKNVCIMPVYSDLTELWPHRQLQQLFTGPTLTDSKKSKKNYTRLTDIDYKAAFTQFHIWKSKSQVELPSEWKLIYYSVLSDLEELVQENYSDLRFTHLQQRDCITNVQDHNISASATSCI